MPLFSNVKEKLEEARDSLPKPKAAKSDAAIKNRKKFAKYSSGVFVNAELTKPRFAMPNTPYINIEEELNAIAKANKIRIALSGSLGGLLALAVLSYSMLAGSFGFIDFSSGKFVTYPAFASTAKIDGGYIKEVGTKVYASVSSEAPLTFFSKVQAGYTGVPNSVVAEVVSLDYGAYVNITDNAVSIKKGDLQMEQIPGVYNGSRSGDIKLAREYIMKCVSGSCTAGELIIVPVDGIVGVID